MTDNIPVLDAEITTWLHRAAELVRSADPLPNGDTITTAAAERVRAHHLSNMLFEEFGATNVEGVDRRALQIPTRWGALRIDEYRRQEQTTGRAPAYLLLHGGGFRLGAIDELINVAFCAQRALDTGYAVYSLEYRLAPENPFPAALDDARSALEWLVDKADELNVDSSTIVVGGVSAGGCIAASLAIDCRDRAYPSVSALLLEVPAVDLRENGVWLHEYAELNGFSELAVLRDGYCAGRSPDDPAVSPLLADLQGLPPVHVMTAEYDPLRAGGEAFVGRLRAAGNRVSATRHLGQLHGSHGLVRELRAARLWHAEVAAVLRDFAR